MTLKQAVFFAPTLIFSVPENTLLTLIRDRFCADAYFSRPPEMLFWRLYMAGFIDAYMQARRVHTLFTVNCTRNEPTEIRIHAAPHRTHTHTHIAPPFMSHDTTTCLTFFPALVYLVVLCLAVELPGIHTLSSSPPRPLVIGPAVCLSPTARSGAMEGFHPHFM